MNSQPTRETLELSDVAAWDIMRTTAELCEDGLATLERMRAWGVRIARSNRLERAIEQVRRVGTAELLLATPDAPRSYVSAVQVICDYRAIQRLLPDGQDRELREQLQISLRCPRSPDDRQPFQFQSQYAAFAALRAAGVECRTPTRAERRKGRSPDLVVRNGLSDYGVEVKRPQSLARIQASVETAAAQLREFGVQGAALLDLSDVVTEVELNAFDSQLCAFGLEAARQLVDPDFDGFRAGCGHVFLVAVLARGATAVEGREKPTLRVHSCSRMIRMATVKGNLADHRAGWLRRALQDGYARLDANQLPSGAG